MAAVANKPFATNYRIPIPSGYVVLNGDQITKIEAKKTPVTDGWTVTFHLSDGSTQVIPPSTWTKEFVQEVFGEVPK